MPFGMADHTAVELREVMQHGHEGSYVSAQWLT